MKLITTLNNLLNKLIYYLEINILLFYSTLFVIFVLCNLIIGALYDATMFLLIDIVIIFLNKYVITCGIILGIFLLNIITIKKHINYGNKIPKWYQILFKLSLFINLLWFICLLFYYYSEWM